MNPPSSSETVDRKQRLFEEALELGGEERKAFLDRECGEDLDLRQELEELLGESQPVFKELEELEQNLILPALDFLRDNPETLNVWMDSIREAGRVADTLIGKTVSHYEICELIGRGGMGMVYRAQDHSLDRDVALKFLPPAFGSDLAAKERFIQEAKAASGLDHPNIAAVHEIGETEDGQMFIAMGYYPGETLKSIIEKGPIPVDEALDIATQIADALKEAHAHGITHRDIKPGNFIIHSNGMVHLLDFGLAKLSYASGYTQIGLMMGTVAYMSPDQARGEEVDARTDIWSLGAVLYEMLTGKRPFGKGDAPSAIHAILHEDPAPPEIPDGILAVPVRDILGRCLQKDPKSRYQSAEALLEDLDRARGGLPLRRRLRQMAWRGQRRRRWIAATAGGIGLAAVVVFSLIKLRPSEPTVVGFEDSGIVEDSSIDVLKRLASEDLADASVCISLGNIYAESHGAFDEAMIWYRKAHALDPENPNIPVTIADIYSLLGDPHAAAWWMDRALATGPDHLLPHAVTIRAYLSKGNLERALEIVRTATDHLKKLEPPLLDRVLAALLDSGDAAAAMTFCEEHYNSFLGLSSPAGGGASFTVIADPFGAEENRVLEFDPGPPFDKRTGRGSLPEDISMPVDHGSAVLLSKAVRPLSEPAQVQASTPGNSKSTLYFRIGRSQRDGNPGTIHPIWGLIEGSAFSGKDITYHDFSIQSRIKTDGILDVRDGLSYKELPGAPVAANGFYSLWYVIDHQENTFDVYVEGTDPVLGQKEAYTGAGYRRKTQGPLDQLVLFLRGGMSDDPKTALDPVYFDDFYFFPNGRTLKHPDSSWILIDDFEEPDNLEWIVQLNSPDQLLNPSRVESALLVAQTLMANDRIEEADAILERIPVAVEIPINQEQVVNLLTQSRISALQGNRDAALAEFRELVAIGHYGWWVESILQGSSFSFLQNDPEFQDLILPIEQAPGKQHLRIRQMDARSEMEVPPQLPYLQVSEAQVRFTPVTGCPLVEERGHFAVASWGDYDADGDLDVIVSSIGGNAPLRLYRNDGNDTFTRVYEGILVNDAIHPMSPVWIDQDNDGDLDLFVSAWENSVNTFYRNDGKGNFSKERDGEWLNTPGDSTGAFWGDYDNDGFPDLLLNHTGAANRLYHNTGDGGMEPVPHDDLPGESQGAIWSDYDNDGDLDLFVTGQERVQFRNDGKGKFTWIGPEQGGIQGFSTNDVALMSADYDNDGDLDMAYTSGVTNPYSILYRNEEGKGFVPAFGIPPIDTGVNCIVPAWGDYDNDGLLDLFLGTFDQANHLYRNEGNGRFTRVLDSPVTRTERNAAVLSWVDYDDDGDLDLFIPNGMFSSESQACELFRNEGNSNAWIQVRLVGTVSNSHALGAKVRAKATIRGETVVQLREIRNRRAHFGLGNATTVDTLTVEWPSGIVQTLDNVAINQLLVVTEPAE